MGCGGGNVQGQSYVPPEVKQVSALTGSQTELLNRLTGYIQSNLGQSGMIPPSYLTPSGYSPLQQQAFGMAGFTPDIARNALMYGNQALQQASQMFNPQDINAAMQPVGDYATSMFQKNLIPSIMGAAGVQGNARSSGAIQQLGEAGKDLSMGLASQFAPLQYQARQDTLNRMMQMPYSASALAQTPGQAASTMANLGSLQRSIPEEQRNYQLSQWAASDPSQNPWLSYLGVALGTPAFTNVGFPATAFQGYRQPSLMESMLPGIGTGAGIAFGSAFL